MHVYYEAYFEAKLNLTCGVNVLIKHQLMVIGKISMY